MRKKLPGLMAAITVVALAAGGLFGWLQPSTPPAPSAVTVYKSPSCGCCGKWVEHLEDNGFAVDVRERDAVGLRTIKDRFAVQSPLQSCHTAVVDGYVIEGHVPAGDIRRLLEEKPAVSGLEVPGMPMGSPGMEGPRQDSYAVLAFNKAGNSTVYNRY